MNQRKQNISSWYSLGIAALLVVFCLVVSTGTTQARYRTEVSESIRFEVRKPVSVYLGTMEYPEDSSDGVFVQNNAGSWEENEDGLLQLDFAISNGTSKSKFEEENQQVYIRLVGSLGIQEEDTPLSLTLTFPNAENPEETEQVKATAARIVSGSALHTTFGEGWIFRFEDDDGRELFWDLKGGELSCIEMALILEDGTLTDASLLQLQIASRYIKE